MKMELSFQEKYDAIGNKDALYEGVFVTAVTTTGIFCRPSCRARKPKAENVIFYDTAQEAIDHGFRPCKICKPLEREGEAPRYIRDIIKELQDNPYTKITDADLKSRGVAPSRIRRWFKKYHNLTFHAYQRSLRINQAHKQIQNGTSVTDTAFDAGYGSLSGFNEGYRNIFADPPHRAKEQRVINIVRFTTELGAMCACATEQGLCLLEFTNRKILEKEFRDLCRRLDAVILPGSNVYLEQVQTEIAEYLDGRRQSFDVPLHMPGTPFQRSVWNLLLQIPYGATRSYSEQAVKLNKPSAVRAVAAANGQNRIAIIVPCHRVIASNGDLTGYGGGLWRKKRLLELEKRYLID